MKIEQFKEKVFHYAKNAGFDDCEILMVRSREFGVIVSKQNIDNYTDAESIKIHFKGLKDGKAAFSSTEVLDEESAKFLVESALENFIVTDTLEQDDIYFEDPKNYKTFKYFDKFETISVREKIEIAKEMEQKALAFDSRIKSVIMSAYEHQRNEIYLANTKGLELEESYGFGGAFVYLFASDGQKPKRGFKAVFGETPEQIDVENAVQEACKDAISQLGAESVPSGKYKVLLRRDALTSLFFAFLSMFSAENVQKNLSPLKGKLGELIASSKLSVSEDPNHPIIPVKRSFDNEGVRTTRKTFIENGKLTTYFHSLKSAKKDNVKPTGNVFATRCQPLTVVVHGGDKNFETLISQIDRGLLIIGLDGLHSGVKTVSGDFSLGAIGYLIEHGKISKPVEQITVAGNFLQMLKDLEEIGSDCELTQVNAVFPSVLISSLDIAGL
ncbi:TldD/PmbA family protein [Pseudothermotoga thermarum]|uniref:Peptidase U62 modulator of DNA gyrase n=1 Tax=Pseudothermotoga thermarum DSM 5069 TaxID=688269 RepID=F7YYC8_9THEM|nr:TldD/PmbA family protein [Pseudothermotoga thermarum]AEH50949.1 peptidase U62 modulator of DNA gyrase [Pseudothermotoga thermarum DSM 5069]